jgi:hypothetical protein
MIAAIIGLALLIVLIVIAMYMISLKRSPDEENSVGLAGPLIHASGIYSIVRKSPRADLLTARPQETEIRKYLASINEDINGVQVSHFEKLKLLEKWQQSMEENIRVVEQGDNDDVEFYYFDSREEKLCQVCAQYLSRGQFVTRQEVYNHPTIIPPFHLGCSTKFVPYQGKENLRETTIIGMRPFFSSTMPPPVPDWKKIIKPT